MDADLLESLYRKYYTPSSVFLELMDDGTAFQVLIMDAWIHA